MKYYLIVGEASGDLHASHLMKELKARDAEADFRFLGGDLMKAQGGTLVRHYKELAYMGFIPVLLHLRTILHNMKACKRDVLEWNPDVLILVDYPGFNLSVAEFVHAHSPIPVYYYISPKIWAWKEYRIKNIKRDVDELFSILPFEVDFFEGKHHYPIHYVGNPTLDEVEAYKRENEKDFGRFAEDNGLEGKPVLALLAGSRKQEIKDNLPMMVEAASVYEGQYELVLAAAPNIDPEFYGKVLRGSRVKILYGQTYRILRSFGHVRDGHVGDSPFPGAPSGVLLYGLRQTGFFLTSAYPESPLYFVGQSGSRARGGQGVGGRRDERGVYTGGTFPDSARRKRTHGHVAGL